MARMTAVKRQVLFVQFVKFSLVGLMNLGVSYAVYISCCKLFDMSPYIANGAAFIISVLNAYIWQTLFVFREQHSTRPWWMTLLRTYAAYSFTGLFLTEVLTYAWLQVVGLGGIIGEDLAVSLVPILNLVFTVPTNFLINKFWTYRERSRE